MLDAVFEALFFILDITGKVAGTESKSVFIRILGIIFWLFVIAGIVCLFIKWFSA